MQEPSKSANKSTNDRSIVNGLLGATLSALNPLPWLAAPLSEALFFTPPRQRPSRSALDFLATGRLFHVRAAGQRIAAWSWGDGPAVLLMHGWGGRGSQLAAFVPPLVEEGLRVIAFDAPAHGASSGSRSSAVDFARTLAEVAEGVGRPRAVIAHSLGATATALSVSWGLGLECAVLIGPPADPTRWVLDFAENFGIGPRVLAALKTRSERRLGIAWSALHLQELAKVKGTPLLVIHDREDREVPFSEGVAVAEAWGAELVPTTGLGHRRILRAPEVVEKAVAFIAGRSAADRLGGDCLQELGTLEKYLFEREAR
jgi:pimeloyl-ACP methyl ester carboxylesterase